MSSKKPKGIKIKIKKKLKGIKRSDIVNNYQNEIDTKLKVDLDNEIKRIGKIDISEVIIYKIGVLINLLNENKKDIRRSVSETIRLTLEIKQDVIKRFLEEYTIFAENQEILQNEQTEFNYYPEINDDNFSYKLSLKREFWKNKIPLINLDYLDKKKNQSVKLFPHQQFAKNYISTNTPYNGLLLWHGVGVGKSCAAISIAENFRQFLYYNNKKILVLTPSGTLMDNWRDEIFNLEKEISKESNINVQCSGSIYLNELRDFRFKEKHQQLRMVKSLINKYYEFKGYQQLFNNITKDLKNQQFYKKTDLREIDKINYIKNKFSNRVIIMDEVHFTREGSTEDKKIRQYLEMIARYAENTKLILLSATPMYNISKEIIWLLNLLLWNDKLAPLEEHQIFDKDGILLVKYDDDSKNGFSKDSKYPPLNWERIKKDHSKFKYYNVVTGEKTKTLPKKNNGNMALTMLIRKARGYISYLRGEDPFRFPFKLYPNDDLYTPSPILQLKLNKWVSLDNSDIIPKNKLLFYKNNISPWQYNNLLRFLVIKDSEQKSAFGQKSIQASNIIFPSSVTNESGDMIGKTGQEGWESCFRKVSVPDSTIEKYEYLDHVKDIQDNTFLHRLNIGTYSKKFENIINSILECQGIVFIFSQFISHGIKSLALALEENGFNRINSNNENQNFLFESEDKPRFCAHHLKYVSELKSAEKPNFQQANYIYLDGNTDKGELSKLVRMQRHENNKNGEKIKVILGSSVVEQGISLYCVREVHVLDPWHHLNKLEQAVGRASRQKSHFNLLPNKRNMTLYIHISSFGDNDKEGKESIDERIYRRAYFKKKNMAKVERQLKVNAIDCFLNKNGNIFISKNYSDLGNKNPLENIKMFDSKGNYITVDLSDQNDTIKCDFTQCSYNCFTKNINTDDFHRTINEDTFSEEFARDEIDLAKEYIKTLFLEEVAYNLDDIFKEIKELDETIDHKFIYYGLDEIVSNKELINDIYNRPGYLLSRNGYYIYQPDNLNDINMPYLYRIKVPEINKYNISLKTNYNRYIPKRFKNPINKTKNIFRKKNIAIKIIDISSIIKKINSADQYIKREYSEYNTGANLPTIDELIVAKKISIIERLTNSEKIQLFSDSLIRVINVEKKIKGYKLTDLDNIMLTHFDHVNKNFAHSNLPKNLSHSILRQRRDIFERLNKASDSSIHNYPIYFRIIEENGNQIYYQYNESSNKFIISNMLDEDTIYSLNIQEIDHYKNNAQVYGWLGILKDIKRENKGKDLYVVNKKGYSEVYNSDGSVREKSKRRGGKCGHAKNCTQSREIAETINIALEDSKFTKKYKDITTKTKGRTLPPKKATTTNQKKNLCEELELVLRCCEYRNKDPKKRFFYKYDEILINKEL
jgi:hypothetical protein